MEDSTSVVGSGEGCAAGGPAPLVDGVGGERGAIDVAGARGNDEDGNVGGPAVADTEVKSVSVSIAVIVEKGFCAAGCACAAEGSGG